MAVYKIYPEKDATIYSEEYLLNSGVDEILELTKTESELNVSQSAVARSLIKFSDDDINNVFQRHIISSSYEANLKMYFAHVSTLPTEYVLIVNPLYESWDMGTGRKSNIPQTKNGVSWKYRLSGEVSPWISGSYPTNVTGSYYSGSIGGGSWYDNLFGTGSYNQYSNKDIDIDITNIIRSYRSGSIINNGFILRTSGSLEFDKNYKYTLSYFSRDTNTIYPPVLEFKWNDYNFSTGSSYSVINDDNVNVSLQMKSEYQNNEYSKIEINVREKYPVRTFSTSSIFTTNIFLPTSSYYSVVDLKTEDIIIDFDDIYTKINTNSNSNYFTLYFNTFQSSRYYKILIKTIISGSEVIFDNDYIFKVK